MASKPAWLFGRLWCRQCRASGRDTGSGSLKSLVAHPILDVDSRLGVNHPDHSGQPFLTMRVMGASGPDLLKELNVLRELIDKLFHGGYQAADRASTERVVARFARGNTSIQQGHYLNADRTDALRKRGDKAASKLHSRVARATR